MSGICLEETSHSTVTVGKMKPQKKQLTQTFTVTYKEEALLGLFLLLGMHMNDKIKMSISQQEAVTTALIEESWKPLRGRSVTVEIYHPFEKDFFTVLALPFFEKIMQH